MPAVEYEVVLFTAGAEIQKAKTKCKYKDKDVGISVCDCHVASLLAMTKRGKLLAMIEEEVGSQ